MMTEKYQIQNKPGFILINFIKHVKGRLTYFFIPQLGLITRELILRI